MKFEDGKAAPRLSTPLLMVLFLSVVNAQNIPMIYPIAFKLPDPPILKGPLGTNSDLTDAMKIHENVLNGTASFVTVGDRIYAGASDNRIWDVTSCPPRLIASLSPPGCNGNYACGQLLSLRFHSQTGYLLALDTYRGLYAVHPSTGQVILAYSINTPVNGRRPVHLNDIAVASDGIIVLSDSSDSHNFLNSVYVCLDGRPTGRLIALMPKTGAVVEFLPGMFSMPNGLEFTPNGDLLVTESCRARIARVSFKKDSWLKVTPFVTNLPGIPDNIRASDRGTYWVGMSYPRHSGIRNPLDENAGRPQYRAQGFNWMSRAQFEGLFNKWAIAVEIDQLGNIVDSVHDPSGSTLSMITEVHEYDGILTVGSHLEPYMARIQLPRKPGAKPNIEGQIQVLRSTCRLPDSQIESTRQRLIQEYQQKQQTSPTLQPFAF